MNSSIDTLLLHKISDDAWKRVVREVVNALHKGITQDVCFYTGGINTFNTKTQQGVFELSSWQATVKHQPFLTLHYQRRGDDIEWTNVILDKQIAVLPAKRELNAWTTMTQRTSWPDQKMEVPEWHKIESAQWVLLELIHDTLCCEDMMPSPEIYNDIKNALSTWPSYKNFMDAVDKALPHFSIDAKWKMLGDQFEYLYHAEKNRSTQKSGPSGSTVAFLRLIATLYEDLHLNQRQIHVNSDGHCMMTQRYKDKNGQDNLFTIIGNVSTDPIALIIKVDTSELERLDLSALRPTPKAICEQIRSDNIQYVSPQLKTCYENNTIDSHPLIHSILTTTAWRKPTAHEIGMWLSKVKVLDTMSLDAKINLSQCWFEAWSQLSNDNAKQVEMFKLVYDNGPALYDMLTTAIALQEANHQEHPPIRLPDMESVWPN